MTLIADHFNVHFGVSPPLLSSESIASVSEHDWATSRSTLQGFGRAVELVPAKRADDAAAASGSGHRTRVRLLQ